MARARNIKPGFFSNELLGTYEPIISLLFTGLWCLADREGILEDRALRIKAELFPYREGLDVNGYLTVLERDAFLTRYEVDGVRYIQINNFTRHQNPHHTEKARGYPKPNGQQGPHGERALTPLNNREITVPERSDSLIPDSLIPDSLIPDSAPNDKDHRSPPSEKITFVDGEFQNVAKREGLWGTAYPAVAIKTELAKAAAWLLANPKNTKSNYERFLTNWFSRAQDKAPAKGNIQPCAIPIPAFDRQSHDAERKAFFDAAKARQAIEDRATTVYPKAMQA